MCDSLLNQSLFFANKCKFRFHLRSLAPYLVEHSTYMDNLYATFASIYPEIITHTTLELMTKLTEYTSPAKQEAKIEAQRRNAEMLALGKANEFLTRN